MLPAQSELSLQTRAKLNNDVEIPVLGLGVYQTPSGTTSQNAVRTALGFGYRHFDTARIYGNESDVDQAIRDSGISREEVFVTTKLWNSDQGYDSAIRACEASLKRLGLDFLDLYLIHFPVTGVRHDSWRAMKKLLETGKCRAVGVSNYTISHLEELLNSSDLVPTINQVEFNPFLYQKELLDYCNSNKIQIEAYSPLTTGERLNHPKVARIAKEHSKSPAQVLIRWSLQHGLVAIPKSTREQRIRENSQVFDFHLSAKDTAELNSLNEDLRTNWDPSNVA
ncbi:MAG TPA: aldo/keto reductase [Candidatus Bathyarchaeia archaeon]|nr:aldo/keto reductase [Candidatus Bathyarchaeia archaeon]